MTDTMERQDIALADAPLARDLVPQDRKLLPAPLEQIQEVGALIQSAGAFVSKELRADPGACVAVAYMAALHKTDPIMTASKAFLVNGRLAFEAQFISAIVRRHIDEPFDITFHGSGAQRFARVVGKVGGKPLEYTSPQIGQIKPKNSPLWITDPDQQLGAYYSVRAWSRRHKPEVLLGIYAVEELQVMVRDVTPAPVADLDGDLHDLDGLPHVEAEEVFEPSGGFTTTPDTPTDDNFPGDRDPDLTGWAKTLAEDASMATDVETLHRLWDEADGKRRALHRQNRSAHDELEKAFIARQNELHQIQAED